MSKVYISDRVKNPTFEKDILGDHLVSEIVEDISVVMVWHQVVDAEYLELFPNLELVIRYGVGYDKIDIDACKNKNIQVSNNPDYCTEEVSHTAVGMILNCTRLLTYYDALSKSYINGWQENVMDNVERNADTIVGVLGMGRIGSLTVRACNHLRYQTQFFDPYVPQGIEKVNNTQRKESLDELLETSDIISLHFPLTRETTGIVDENFIAKMKKGSSLVNTARGTCIKNLDVIYDALKSNHLKMVCLDVLPNEPPQDCKLIRAWKDKEPWLEGRLIINPHASYHSKRSQLEQRENVAKNALLYIKTGEVRNRVA